MGVAHFNHIMFVTWCGKGECDGWRITSQERERESQIISEPASLQRGVSQSCADYAEKFNHYTKLPLLEKIANYVC